MLSASINRDKKIVKLCGQLNEYVQSSLKFSAEMQALCEVFNKVKEDPLVYADNTSLIDDATAVFEKLSAIPGDIEFIYDQKQAAFKVEDGVTKKIDELTDQDLVYLFTNIRRFYKTPFDDSKTPYISAENLLGYCLWATLYQESLFQLSNQILKLDEAHEGNWFTKLGTSKLREPLEKKHKSALEVSILAATRRPPTINMLFQAMSNDSNTEVADERLKSIHDSVESVLVKMRSFCRKTNIFLKLAEGKPDYWREQNITLEKLRANAQMSMEVSILYQQEERSEASAADKVKENFETINTAFVLCERMIGTISSEIVHIIALLQDHSRSFEKVQKKINSSFELINGADEWINGLLMNKAGELSGIQQRLEDAIVKLKGELITLGINRSSVNETSLENLNMVVIEFLKKKYAEKAEQEKRDEVENEEETKEEKGKEKVEDSEVKVAPDIDTPKITMMVSNLKEYIKEEYDPTSASQDNLAELQEEDEDDIGSHEAVNCDVVAMRSSSLTQGAALIRVKIEEAGIDELLCVNTKTKQWVKVGRGEDLLADKNKERTEYLLIQARKKLGIDRINDDTDPFADCDFISMSLPPLKQNAAYVRIQIQDADIDTLLYVNKVNRACQKIDIDPRSLQRFDEIIEPSEEVKTLTDNQLKKINRITKHPHVDINEADANTHDLTDAQIIAKENAKKMRTLQYGVMVQNSNAIAFGTLFTSWSGGLGAVIGASLGLAAGVFLSPFTLGASIPTCMLIGAGVGSVVAGSVGLLVGATAGAIEDEAVEDERTALITKYNNEIDWTRNIIEKLESKAQDNYNFADDLVYPELTKPASPVLDDWSSEEKKPSTKSWLSMLSMFKCGCSQSMSRSSSFDSSETLSIDSDMESDNDEAEPINPLNKR